MISCILSPSYNENIGCITADNTRGKDIESSDSTFQYTFNVYFIYIHYIYSHYNSILYTAVSLC